MDKAERERDKHESALLRGRDIKDEHVVISFMQQRRTFRFKEFLLWTSLWYPRLIGKTRPPDAGQEDTPLRL